MPFAKVTILKPNKKCSPCRGRGVFAVPGGAAPCPECKGTGLVAEQNEDLDALEAVLNTRPVFVFAATDPSRKLPPLVKTCVQLPIGEMWLAETPAEVLRRLRVAEQNVGNVGGKEAAEEESRG